MPIPKEILAVERPRNTLVIAYGKNKDKYAVRQRIGCRYDNGRHLPVNGAVIGHIVDFVYVPKKQKVSESDFTLKDWAIAVHCHNVFRDILQDLCTVYEKTDAEKLYSISSLRVSYPGVKDSELKEKYEGSFLSEIVPDVALSKNVVSTFLRNVGGHYSKIIEFLRIRTAAVPIDHHLIIDGTLKTNDSKVNSLSHFSRKSKKKGGRNISVLMAFDLEAQDPVCFKCFPGNMLDLTAYDAFISENKISKGIIIADKGFPASAAREQFDANPGLHYLNPIKRNSQFVERHRLHEYTGYLKGYEGIEFRKEKCTGTDKWLYSYRDSSKAAMEEIDWHRRNQVKGIHDQNVTEEKRKSFGTIILESDLDLEPEVVYKAYGQRWEIEIVMRYYKTTCELNDTRVHDDYSVIGSEFCNFLATILTWRLIKSFDKEKLLDGMTYKRLISILVGAKKVYIEKEGWKHAKINPSQVEVLQKLGLIPKPEEPPKRKPGRPKGSKNKVNASDIGTEVKRRPGRPKGSKNKPKIQAE